MTPLQLAPLPENQHHHRFYDGHILPGYCLLLCRYEMIPSLAMQWTRAEPKAVIEMSSLQIAVIGASSDLARWLRPRLTLLWTPPRIKCVLACTWLPLGVHQPHG
jgi:hypothetical protein